MNLMNYLWRRDCPTAENLLNFYQSSLGSLSMIESEAMDTIVAMVINESKKTIFHPIFKMFGQRCKCRPFI